MYVCLVEFSQMCRILSVVNIFNQDNSNEISVVLLMVSQEVGNLTLVWKLLTHSQSAHQIDVET